jgi:AcrR family transcriptional regulator
LENRTTKQRILDTALQLFNTKGISNITVRHIAAEMGISHGNLCYHYATREDIIYALYQQLVDAFNGKMAELEGKELTFSDTLESSKFAVNIFYKYRFLMLDFISIVRADERIKSHYKDLMQLRKLQFRLLFDKAVTNGFMRAEFYPEEFDTLGVLFAIVGDSWIAHSEIHFVGTEEEKLKFYGGIIFSVFSPYLTPAGWAEMKKSS